MKKFILISILIFIFISLSPTLSYAQVNIIENWGGDTLQKVTAEYGSNATVVVVGSPDNDGFAQVINSYSFNWVIRGHAWWTGTGQKMAADPAGAASDWANFFKNKLDGSKTVYFEPWNEPSSVDPECKDICGSQTSDWEQCFDQCMPVVNQFIDALIAEGIPGYVKLTTPSIDPHNGVNTDEEMISKLGRLGRFSVYSAHAYSPEAVDEILAKYGDKPIIFTETGVIVDGKPTYEEMPLCADMYCKNGTIGKLQSTLGYALFSNYPQEGWNLWEHECVVDALKGDCHCETCEEEGGKKATAKEMYERTGGETPSLEDPNVKVGRNWPGGATTMEANSRIWQILLALLRIFFGEIKALFRIIHGRGPIIAFLRELLGSQDLVPSDRNGRYPGEDYYVEKILDTNSLELPGTTAQICLPSRDISYIFSYYPDRHPEKFMVELVNLTSVHEQVANSMLVYNKMRQWTSGSAYSDYLEYIDMSEKEGEQQMAKRSLTELFRAGYLSRRLPGAELTLNAPEENETLSFANLRLKDLLGSGDPTHQESPLYDPENIEKSIAVADKTLGRTCSAGDKDLLTEHDFRQNTEDHRVNRSEVENCEQPFEIKPDLMTCCDRNHVENVLGLDYDKVCEDTPGWACIGNEPVVTGEIIWGKYFRGKLAADSGVSETDWPIYLEQCFVAKEEKCEEEQSYQGLFVDLTDGQRAEIFPPSTWNDTYPRNTFLTEAMGECLSCQIVKLFLPEGLGALDGCRHMTSSFLPGSMYEEMINKDYGQKKAFSCDVGELPYTDSEETNKDNADYKNFQRTWDEERWHGFFTEVEVNNSGTTNYVDGVPQRSSTTATVKSYMHLYVPHYEKLQVCTDLYYGLLPGKESEKLQKDLEELNEYKLEAKHLLERTKVNPIVDVEGSAISAGLVSGSTAVEVQANINQGKEVYLPGGGTDAGVNASQKLYIPASKQEDWLSVSAVRFSNQDSTKSNGGNWSETSSEMMDIPGFFKTEVSSLKDKIIPIAQEVGVPPEVPLVLWFKESGGKRENPANGEGLCGFHDLVNQGQTFPPGPISENELLRQLKLCAQEYKKRSFTVTFNTTDPDVIGWGYANYNGNVDCMGNSYPTWTDHPYVMNGYDAEHMNMVARKSTDYGPDNCVTLSVIGAWPAHLRIRELLYGL